MYIIVRDVPIIRSACQTLAYQPYFLNIGIDFTLTDITNVSLTHAKLELIYCIAGNF